MPHATRRSLRVLEGLECGTGTGSGAEAQGHGLWAGAAILAQLIGTSSTTSDVNTYLRTAIPIIYVNTVFMGLLIQVPAT